MRYEFYLMHRDLAHHMKHIQGCAPRTSDLGSKWERWVALNRAVKQQDDHMTWGKLFALLDEKIQELEK